MIRMFFCVLALVSLFIFSCSSSSIRFTQDEIKDYPVEMQEHIIKGEIVPGMTPTQVRYAWGSPDEVMMPNALDGKPQEQWVYSSHAGIFKTRLTFVEGKLVSIVSSEPGRVK